MIGKAFAFVFVLIGVPVGSIYASTSGECRFLVELAQIPTDSTTGERVAEFVIDKTIFKKGNSEEFCSKWVGQRKKGVIPNLPTLSKPGDRFLLNYRYIATESSDSQGKIQRSESGKWLYLRKKKFFE